MFEKLFQLLVIKHPGVRKDGLKQMARSLALHVTTEEEAAQQVEKLSEEAVTNFVKEFRADVDKEVTEGNKPFESNLKKKYTFVGKQQKEEAQDGGDDTDAEPGSDIATLIKDEIRKALAPLNQEKISNSRFQQLKEHVDTCKDETLKSTLLGDYPLMSFESDEQFEEHLEKVKERVETTNQNLANIALTSMGKPMFSEKTPDGVSAGVSSYVESKTGSDDGLTGKEV